jgi:hypothetical protein
MHPTLKRALLRAQEIVDEALAPARNNAARLAELKALPKKDLISLVAELEGLNKVNVPIGDLAARILCDEECVWLTYDMIHAVLKTKLPDIGTTVKNLSWYASHYRNEKGMDVQLRKPAKEISKLLIING